MKKIIILLLSAILFVSCSAKNTESKNESTKEYNKIIVLGPTITQIVISLGNENKIIATDDYSKNYLQNTDNLPIFDLMNPDVEKLVSLSPDIIIATNMMKANDTNPLKLIEDMGIKVLYIKSSESIAEIKNSITLIGDELSKSEKANEIIKNIDSEIEKYKKIGETITDKKSVYFEVGNAPNLYTFGTGTFLNEIIEIVGCNNIFSDEEGWITVSEESIVSRNPDIIFTNIDYIEDPVFDIISRNGFNEISAVKNDRVYKIDNAISSYANQNIVKAIEIIAKHAYPEVYKD